jgi:group I intron endonuclease
MEIYKITNLVNGKSYIGQTINTFNERYPYGGEGAERVFNYLAMREQKSKAYNERLYYNGHLLKAFRKYGIENFTVEIIDTAKNIDELNEKEKYWVNRYNAMENGYNHCEGGNGTKGYNPSEETRKLWSKLRRGVHKGKNNPNYGGKYQTEETRKKMSLARKGKLTGGLHPKAKAVINLDTLEVFSTLTQACEIYNVSVGNLTNVLQRKKHGKHGTRKQAGGYRWMYYDEYRKKGDIVGRTKNNHHKAVINLDTGEIFETTKQAGERYGVDNSGIIKTCKGKQKSCGGYRWEYYTQE